MVTCLSHGDGIGGRGGWEFGCRGGISVKKYLGEEREVQNLFI